MKNKLQILISSLILILGIVGVTNASGLWNLYQSRGLDLPSISARADVAAECGLFYYSGDYYENLMIESCMKDVDFWVDKIKNNGERTWLSDEVLKIIPEESWYLVTPQVSNQPVDEELLGAAVVTRYRTRLASSMTSSQDNIPVSSVTTFDGTTLTMSLVDGVIYLTLEPGSKREEIIKCTSLSGTTWGDCTRGLSFSGTSESAVSANKEAHNAGSVVVMSNVHYVYEKLVDKDSEETITGIKTYTNYPIGPGLAPTTSAQLADKLYVDTVGAGGFTSLNIGDGKTLRANGTAPETLDINTTTPGLTNQSFVIDTDGFFAIATPTNSLMDNFWDIKLNATSTMDNMNFASTTLSDNTLINGNTTTTGSWIFNTSPFGVDGSVKQMVAGESITPKKALYGSATSSRVLLADDDLTTTSTVNFVGISLTGGEAGDNIFVQTNGIYTDTSANYTTTTPIYISDAGALSETPGTFEGIVGRAINSTQINMDSQFGMQFILTNNDGGNDLILVPNQARIAIIDVACVESSLSTTSNFTGILTLKGKASINWTDVGDATAGSDKITCSASWSAGQISLSFSDDADVVSGTAYFYY